MGYWSLHPSTLEVVNLNDSFIVQALVWVRLHELPLDFWNEDIFVGLARTFGELLSTNPNIASKCHLNYPCLCIGVREGIDMPETMAFHSKLGVHIQKMIYETVPFAFFLYLKAGHKASQCPKVDK